MNDASAGRSAGDSENRLTVEYYQFLLSELRSALAERARAEQELAALDSAADSAASGSPESAQRLLATNYESSASLADEQHALEQQAVDGRYQAATEAASAAFSRESGELQRTADAELERIERKFQEDCWLLSSIHDDKSENSPKWQIEKLKAQLQQSQERLSAQADEVASLYEQAVALVEQRRQRCEPEPAPTAAAANRDRALEAANAAAQLVREQFAQLSQQVVPRLLTGWNSVVPCALLWGGLAAAGYVLVSPGALGLGRVTPGEWMIMTAGAALAVVGVMLVVVYAVAVAQTARVFE
ncbi:MAG TPA: hypothetical protein VGH74_17475, partial [Planctomycetaceae bacterium]